MRANKLLLVADPQMLGDAGRAVKFPVTNLAAVVVDVVEVLQVAYQIRSVAIISLILVRTAGDVAFPGGLEFFDVFFVPFVELGCVFEAELLL